MADAGELWRVISEFESMADYEDLLARLTAEVTHGGAKSVPVDRPYSGSTLWDERWFNNRRTGEVWRLVAPDPPFRGLFNRTDNNDL